MGRGENGTRTVYDNGGAQEDVKELKEPGPGL